MLLKIFTRLFNWRPKPLTYNQYTKVLNDNYQISSQNPSTLTHKESGYLLVKSTGKTYIFCNDVLILHLKQNINVITIGWIGNKTQILDIKHHIFASSRSTSINSHYYSTSSTTSADGSFSSNEQRTTSNNDSYDCGSTSDGGSGDCSGGGGD